LSKDKDNFDIAAVTIFLVFLAVTFLVLVAVSYSTIGNSTQTPFLGSIQLASTSIDVTGLNGTDLNINLKAVICNPNLEINH
jgi:hypothetical protein